MTVSGDSLNVLLHLLVELLELERSLEYRRSKHKEVVNYLCVKCVQIYNISKSKCAIIWVEIIEHVFHSSRTRFPFELIHIYPLETISHRVKYYMLITNAHATFQRDCLKLKRVRKYLWDKLRNDSLQNRPPLLCLPFRRRALHPPQPDEQRRTEGPGGNEIVM